MPTMRNPAEPSEFEHLGKWKAEIERLTKTFVQGQNGEEDDDNSQSADLLSGLGLHKILEKTIQEKLKDVFQKYQPNPSRARNPDRRAETPAPPQPPSPDAPAPLP